MKAFKCGLVQGGDAAAITLTMHRDACWSPMMAVVLRGWLTMQLIGMRSQKVSKMIKFSKTHQERSLWVSGIFLSSVEVVLACFTEHPMMH